MLAGEGGQGEQPGGWLPRPLTRHLGYSYLGLALPLKTKLNQAPPPAPTPGTHTHTLPASLAPGLLLKAPEISPIVGEKDSWTPKGPQVPRKRSGRNET